MNAIEQRDAARLVANAVRAERATLRQRVHKGHQSIADSAAELASILDGGVPRSMRSAKLGAVLQWVFKVQPPRRRMWAAEAGSSFDRRLGDLTDQQLERLLAALRMSAAELSDRALVRADRLRGRT